MRSLGFTGVALFVLAASVPSAAIADSGVGAPPVVMPGGQAPAGARGPLRMPARGPMPPMVQPLPGVQHVGSMAGYRTPFYGYQLPRTWMVPTYFITDYRGYGLARPAPGFGWSRYYNAAVLTDQWGRVYDWRTDMNWDGGAYSEGETGNGIDYDRVGRGGSGIGGAVIGGVVGGVAGNVIAGRGNRLAGTLIGGGLGALAGQAIDKSSRRHHGLFGRRDRDERDYDSRYDRGGEWRDRGEWHEEWQSGPHWGGGSWGASSGGSWGYDTGGTTVTTVVVQPSHPVMQTQTITTYEYVTVAKKRAVRHYRPKPRPRPQCVCGS